MVVTRRLFVVWQRSCKMLALLSTLCLFVVG